MNPVRKMIFSKHIGALIDQTLMTFTAQKSEPHQFAKHLDGLKGLINKTTAQDVNLPVQFMTEAIWYRPNKAPVTYLHVHECETASIGVFILKSDMKLPLHNHPKMYGLIKVIAGRVKITSYSLETDRTREYMGQLGPNQILVEECNEAILESSHPCSMLDPKNGNLHEIESVDGPAAFLDVLAPPYETPIEEEDDEMRKCSYFQLVDEVLPKIWKLQECESPSWYWSDQLTFTPPGSPSH